MQIENPTRRRHAISLTPLIDVVFILLVFFMLATSFTDWRPIHLAVGAAAQSKQDRPPAVVHVGRHGAMRYNDTRYSADELAATLVAARRRGAISAVIVAPADATPLAATVEALDALAGAGVAPLSLATQGRP